MESFANQNFPYFLKRLPGSSHHLIGPYRLLTLDEPKASPSLTQPASRPRTLSQTTYGQFRPPKLSIFLKRLPASGHHLRASNHLLNTDEPKASLKVTQFSGRPPQLAQTIWKVLRVRVGDIFEQAGCPWPSFDVLQSFFNFR